MKCNGITFHIGYPKAASSTLQRCLFNLHDEINYFGTVPTGNVGRDTPLQSQESRYLRDEQLQQFHRSLTQADDKTFSEADIEEQLQKLIAPLLETNEVNLLSNERFLSVFFSYPNLEAKAERLRRLVPHAQVLIVIRNQIDLITSQYRDWPFDPRDFTGGEPVSIDRWVDIALQHDDEIGFLRSLRYNKMIELYEDLFGRDAMSVLCLEQLARDVTAFAKTLSSSLQIDVSKTETLLRNAHENRGVTQKKNTYRRLKRLYPVVNRIERLVNRVDRVTGLSTMNRFNAVLDTGPKASYTLSDEQEEKIQDFFSSSNRSMERKYQLPLPEYSYP